MKTLNALFRDAQRRSLLRDQAAVSMTADQSDAIRQELDECLLAAHQVMTLMPRIGKRLKEGDSLTGYECELVSIHAPAIPRRGDRFTPSVGVGLPHFQWPVQIPYLRREPHESHDYQDYLVHVLRQALVNVVYQMDALVLRHLRLGATVSKSLTVAETHNVVQSLTGLDSIAICGCGVAEVPGDLTFSFFRHLPWAVSSADRRTTLVEQSRDEKFLRPSEVHGINSATLAYGDPVFRLRNVEGYPSHLSLAFDISLPRFIAFDGTTYSS